jgi:hypothetical protein
MSGNMAFVNLAGKKHQDRRQGISSWNGKIGFPRHAKNGAGNSRTVVKDILPKSLGSLFQCATGIAFCLPLVSIHPQNEA